MKYVKNYNLILLVICVLTSCMSRGPVVTVTRLDSSPSVESSSLSGLDQEALDKLAEIKKSKKENKNIDVSLNQVIESTPNLTISEYNQLFPEIVNKEKIDYKVGGYDVISITVYEEPDLSKEHVRVSADGYISFPLIGRLKVDNLSTSEIEALISQKLAEGQFLFDAHISVIVTDYQSKQFLVLGSVKEPGTYPLRANERVLDAISKAKGIDFEQGGKQAMIIRTQLPNADFERKIVIRIDLGDLLKGSDQISNILLADKDMLYIPKPDFFYIIGQIAKPGSYPYVQKEISLVEAISMAGGFTPIAARNRTRIIRVEDGVEKIIEVKVDAITNSGKKAQDVKVKPEDVIVVPESFF